MPPPEPRLSERVVVVWVTPELPTAWQSSSIPGNRHGTHPTTTSLCKVVAPPSTARFTQREHLQWAASPIWRAAWLAMEYPTTSLILVRLVDRVPVPTESRTMRLW